MYPRASRPWVALPQAVSALTMLAIVVGCTPQDRLSSRAMAQPLQTERQRSGDLLHSPPVISLGNIKSGGKASGEIVVTNAGTSTAEVVSIVSSCPCVRIEPARFQLSPNEHQTLQVYCDMSDDPQFVGGLGIRIELFGPANRKLGEFQVDVRVEGAATL